MADNFGILTTTAPNGVATWIEHGDPLYGRMFYYVISDRLHSDCEWCDLLRQRVGPNGYLVEEYGG